MRNTKKYNRVLYCIKPQKQSIKKSEISSVPLNAGKSGDHLKLYFKNEVEEINNQQVQAREEMGLLGSTPPRTVTAHLSPAQPRFLLFVFESTSTTLSVKSNALKAFLVKGKNISLENNTAAAGKLQERWRQPESSAGTGAAVPYDKLC